MLQSSSWTTVMNMLMLCCSRAVGWRCETCWCYAAVEQLDDGVKHAGVMLQSSSWMTVWNMLVLCCSRAVGQRWCTCWHYAAVKQLDDGDDDDEPTDIRLQSSSWTMVTTVMNMLTLGCSRAVGWRWWTCWRSAAVAQSEEGGGGWRRCTCWHQAARQAHAPAAKPAAHGATATTAATAGSVVQASPSLVAVVVAMSGWSGDTRTHTQRS